VIRKILVAGLLSLAAATALAAPLLQDRDAAEAAPVAASPTAEAFANALTASINDVLSANAALADLVQLQTLLEQAIETTFLSSNVSPEAALKGVDQARNVLVGAGVMCDLPDGAASKRCEAVALAFILAQNAAEAAQAEPTGALGGNAGAALGALPATGGGGGGGGVTHPPVTQ